MFAASLLPAKDDLALDNVRSKVKARPLLFMSQRLNPGPLARPAMKSQDMSTAIISGLYSTSLGPTMSSTYFGQSAVSSVTILYASV